MESEYLLAVKAIHGFLPAGAGYHQLLLLVKKDKPRWEISKSGTVSGITLWLWLKTALESASLSPMRNILPHSSWMSSGGYWEGEGNSK
jgi:hypothetical protein